MPFRRSVGEYPLFDYVTPGEMRHRFLSSKQATGGNTGARRTVWIAFSLLLVALAVASCTSANPAPPATDAGDGSAPPAVCASDIDCNDGVACTIDRCVDSHCVHTAASVATGPHGCPDGAYCDPRRGCVPAPTCGDDATCIEFWREQACMANVRCDMAVGRCAFAIPDRDADGHADGMCGGDDCDDTRASAHPGASESCNGRDDDCNGQIDDGTTLCPNEGQACQHGQCSCPIGFGWCNEACVDIRADAANCGTCGHHCPGGCELGKCACPPGEAFCSEKCVDTQSNLTHCGGCYTLCTGNCTRGVCTCAAGEVTCALGCTNVKESDSSCGACERRCDGACAGAHCIMWTTESVPSYHVASLWGTGRSDVWAVGFDFASTSRGIVLHYDGNAWAEHDAGAVGSLSGVFGTGPDDVWAVGDAIVHWQGNRWTAMPLDLGGAALAAVWASGARNAWAVGTGGTVVHWDGASWTKTATSTSATLQAIWGADAANVWAAGVDGTVLRWNGTSWSSSQTPGGKDIYGLWGSGPNDVWGVGNEGWISHWNGTAWTASQQVSMPTPTFLKGIWGFGASDVWVAGPYDILHWDGSRWHSTHVRNEDHPMAIWGSDPRDLWISEYRQDLAHGVAAW